VHAPADPQPQLPRPTVFKAFMGSDTTLIAAETTGRVCFGL
jgi:DNA modification methylase